MILITRPTTKAASLQQFLAHHGLKSHITSLIEFDQIKNYDLIHQLNQLTSSDFLISISENAVNFANNLLRKQQMTWPDSPCYIAVGASTGLVWQELLHQSGVRRKVILPREATTEGLLALPQLQQIRGKTGLILRGNGGRELLFESLKKRGALMFYQEVYQRRPVKLPANQVQRWQELGVNTVILTSGEMLQLFAHQTRLAHDWARTLRLIVPSWRLAEQARQAGFVMVQVAGGADHEAIYRAICLKTDIKNPSQDS